MCIHLNLMIFTKIIRGFISAEQQRQDKTSLFAYYQQLITLRRHSEISDILIYGIFTPLTAPDNVIAFKRTHQEKSVNIYCNFSQEEKVLSVSIEHLYLHNSPIVTNKQGDLVLQPYQAVIFS
ncbi:DUF3459 domain-containing protein [Proteus mirabilis]|uniref:DUF3459 domain-containing protein n=1 Tax=Proteus mirabilis TaxID=584 RepID=UPI0036AC4729